MKKSYRFALAALAMILTVSTAQAASVYNISTGTADWQIVDKPAADPNALGPAIVIQPNGAWNSSLVDADTKWVGIEPDNRSRGYAGDYVYRLDMAIDNPGDYVVSGAFTSDNLVKSLKVNGVEVLTGPQTEIESFRKIFDFDGTGDSQNLTIEATVYNAVWPTAPDPKNPTGFILGGEVQIVPVPAAAWAGMAMLGGLGVIRKLRNK